MKLIDTSVAVDHLRGVDRAVDLLMDLASQGEEVAASELVRFELLVGARGEELPSLNDLFSALTWVPVDADVARVGASLAQKYRKSHGGIDDVDYLIAATAVVLGADLLTVNVRHFPMWPALQPPY